MLEILQILQFVYFFAVLFLLLFSIMKTVYFCGIIGVHDLSSLRGFLERDVRDLASHT